MEKSSYRYSRHIKTDTNYYVITQLLCGTLAALVLP